MRDEQFMNLLATLALSSLTLLLMVRFSHALALRHYRSQVREGSCKFSAAPGLANPQKHFIFAS